HLERPGPSGLPLPGPRERRPARLRRAVRRPRPAQGQPGEPELLDPGERRPLALSERRDLVPQVRGRVRRGAPERVTPAGEPPAERLRGEVVRLRLVTAEDAPRLAEILSRPEVARWWGEHDAAR